MSSRAYPPAVAAFPWGGVVDSTPQPLSPVNSFKQAVGWFIDKGRLKTSPNSANSMNTPDSTPILAVRSFMDVYSNVHTIVLTQTGAYYLNNTNVYTYLGGYNLPCSVNQFSMEVLFNQLFFANGSNNVQYVDGGPNYGYINAPGSCFFLGKLTNRLFMVNTIEPAAGVISTPYPRRLRWSASNNPFQWDPTVDPTAGVVDIPDVEDQLTGWATLGSNGFAFRNNGITAVIPSQGGILPFTIENFSIGPTGVGVSVPYSLATYGTFCVFAALDDIYMFAPSSDTSGLTPIGGNAIRSIFADLATSSDLPYATIVGQFPQNFEYLSYWLFLPQSNNTFTKAWRYHFASQTWMSESIPYGKVYAFSNVAVA